MISALGGVIMETKTVKDDMEGFVSKSVLPELRSQQGFMRQIVCSTLANFMFHIFTHITLGLRSDWYF